MGEPEPESQRLRPGWLIPDEILIDIISRLPAKAVLRWRCVSMKWKDITSTPDFVRLHMGRSNPMILVEDDDSKQFLDNWWESDQPQKSVIHRFANRHEYRTTLFSQDGLLVMKLISDFVIFNPINHEHVRIILRPETSDYIRVYGIYWHPNLKEYCIIFEVSLQEGRDKNSYHIVNLGSDPRCRHVRNPWNDRFAYSSTDPPPVLVDNHLYQIVFLFQEQKLEEEVHFILDFDIITEEFQLISSPDKQWWQELSLVQIREYIWHENVNLVNIDGQLSLVRICPNKEVISIHTWTLLDHGRHVWGYRNYKISCEVWPITAGLRAIAFADGKLVIGSSYTESFYICDLNLGKAKLFGMKNCTDLKMLTTNMYDQWKMKSNNYYCHSHLRHVMSLASLGNCKSKISLNIGPSRYVLAQEWLRGMMA